MAEKRSHVADGIEEFDNPLPRWWLYGFYATIAFAVVYCVLYPSAWFWNGTLGWSSAGQLERQLAAVHAHAAAAARVNPRADAPELVKLSHDAAIVAQGKQIFAQNCAVCHGAHAEGKIGPSLHRPKFKFGKDAVTILTTISEGRPGGMPVWGKIMPREKILHVAAFVYSFRYTDVHGAAPTTEAASR